MTLRLFIPVDAGALAVGAEEVAAAIGAAAARRKVAVEIVRTGSRGLYWLEPMVELETPAGRVAYGPVAASDAEALLGAILADGAHKLRLGPTEDIPWLKRQTRLTFAPLRRRRSALAGGLSRARRLQGTRTRACGRR